MFKITVKVENVEKPYDENKLVDIVCFHCSRTYSLAQKEIRAANYCSSCR
jgi:redox-regulated HSP33 family molecular chaperone